ncbi:EAL domain-containing protein [Pseudomonas sp. AMR01]|uniref:EAL domain-containing protein n=1 Tax=Pseudomonas sp. AMR01 TaxID=3064904 RepID=UPI0035C0D441
MFNSREIQPRLKSQGFSISEIVKALSCSEFKAYYQPKVELFGLDLSGLEVLVRWKHPELGVLTPDKFLHTVIAGGLLNEMTRSLLDQALIFQKRLACRSIRTAMAINLEPSQVTDSGFIRAFIAQANSHDITNNALTIEITERANESLSFPKFARNSAKLKAAGFSVSIDDFGIGYSSLERVCKTPCSEIKIDRVFVENMCSDVQYRKMIELMVNIGSTLQLNVVAEGIETLQQLNLLQSLGCHHGQGHLFSAALPSEQIEQWCIKWSGCIFP